MIKKLTYFTLRYFECWPILSITYNMVRLIFWEFILSLSVLTVHLSMWVVEYRMIVDNSINLYVTNANCSHVMWSDVGFYYNDFQKAGNRCHKTNLWYSAWAAEFVEHLASSRLRVWAPALGTQIFWTLWHRHMYWKLENTLSHHMVSSHWQCICIRLQTTWISFIALN